MSLAGGSALERAMQALLVVCHHCGRGFPSEISFGEEGFLGRFLHGVVYTCPHCGKMDPYFTAEHHLPGSQSYSAGRAPGYEPWVGTFPTLVRHRRG
jgi:hypothetical protein